MPTTQFRMEGNRTVKLYSYVVVLCKKGGDDVHAVRFDGYERKTDLFPVIEEKYPMWKVKAIHKLYDEDFE